MFIIPQNPDLMVGVAVRAGFPRRRFKKGIKKGAVITTTPKAGDPYQKALSVDLARSMRQTFLIYIPSLVPFQELDPR